MGCVTARLAVRDVLTPACNQALSWWSWMPGCVSFKNGSCAKRMDINEVLRGKGSDGSWLLLQWSPWTAMPDCYEKFCCVENAKFGTPATVEPGASWSATQDIAIIDLE